MRLLSSAIEGPSVIWGFCSNRELETEKCLTSYWLWVLFNPVKHRAQVPPSGELEPTLCGWFPMENSELTLK